MGYGITTTAEVPNTYYASVPEPSNKIMATPQSTLALGDLAKASADYAQAAESFVFAREALNGARSRWQEIRDAVAKATEQEGV